MSHKNTLLDILYQEPVPGVIATYKPSQVPAYAGNRYIEALPPMADQAEWLTRLQSSPAMAGLPEDAGPAERSACVVGIRDFHFPLPRETELAQRIDQVIRAGYVARNGQAKAYANALQEAYAEIQAGGNKKLPSWRPAPVASISLIGTSGVGKTTATQVILGQFPQVIYHPNTGEHQIAWMHIDCPSNGDIRQLGLDVVAEIDRLMGTTFLRFARAQRGEGEVLAQVVSLVRTYNLGLLVIDEIQNLVTKKTEGRERMMNFFQSLCNRIHVPVMFLGTKKAMRILRLDFRNARRAGALGSFVWDQLKADDPAWTLLVRRLWNYQWLHNKTPWDPSMGKLLFDQTQGIVAVLISLFTLAQLRAISTGEEALSRDLFSRVMKADLSYLKPALSALRSGDPARLRRFEDIWPEDLRESLEQQVAAAHIATQSTSRRSGSKPMPATQKAIEILEAMGYDNETAYAAITAIAGLDFGKARGHRSLVQSALRWLGAAGPGGEPEPDDPEDLRLPNPPAK